MVKLNLGSGELKPEGYENIDLKSGKTAYPLDYPDNYADEIRASHLLEHFDGKMIRKVLAEWVRVLKPNGILKISVPNFDWIAEHWKNKEERGKLLMVVMGGQVDANDYHKSLYNADNLGNLLKDAGLENIQTWTDDIKDCASFELSLNLQGTKPESFVAKTEEEKVKISAVWSTPRVGFTGNFKSATSVFPKLGIPMLIGQGAFWSQVLSRMIEERLKLEDDYIFTLDYDTIFTEDHVRRLCQLIVSNPQADAIVPVQIKRENETAMFTVVDEHGNQVDKILQSDLDKELVRIWSGHFGLTIFKASAFKDLPKPWFKGVPNKDGEWNDGRIDDDIYFWHNWSKSGRTIYLANNVSIGHAQLLYTWPSKHKDNYKPIHQYVNDFDKDGPPPCVIEGLKKEVAL